MAKTQSSTLTDKQARFVEEYLIDNNGTQAAIRAGYSPNTAESQASRLLTNAKVREAVEFGRDEIKQKTDITRERLMEMAEDVYTLACAAEQFGAANGAIKELGILSGERVEKQEQTVISHEDRLLAVKERLNGRRSATTH